MEIKMRTIVNLMCITCGLYGSPLLASAVSEPFHDSQIAPVQSSETVKQMFERLLVEAGELKPGEQLALHEVWRIASELKARRAKTVNK